MLKRGPWRFAAIWLMALAAAVAVGVFAYQQHLAERERALRDTSKALEGYLSGSLATLNRQLLTVDLLLAAQAAQAQRQAGVLEGQPAALQGLRQAWRGLLDQQLLIDDLLLVDRSGDVIVAARQLPVTPGPSWPEGFVEATLDVPFPTMRVGPPATLGVGSNRALWFARALPQQPQSRVLLARVSLTAFGELFSSGSRPETWELTVERDDGLVLATQTAADPRVGQRLPQSLRQGRIDGRAEPTRSRLVDEPALRTAQASLYPSVLMSVSQPQSAIDREIQAEFAADRPWLLGAVVTLVGLAGLLHWHLRGETRARQASDDARAALARQHAELVQQVRARELADAERERAQRLFSQLLTQTHEGYWHVDTEGRVVDVNPAMSSLLGRRREAILGHHVLEFVNEEHAATLRRHLTLRGEGLRGTYEISLQRPDGELVECITNETPIVGETGQRAGFVGLWTDISAMKATQRALTRTQATLDSAINAMAEGFIVFGPDDRVVLFNQRYLEIFPFLRDSLRPGLHVDQIQARSLQALMPQACESEQLRWTQEQRRQHRASGEPWEQTLVDGRVVQTLERRTPDGGFVSVSRDVTEAHRTARALQEARDAAESAARVKSQFLAAMSHEIRTPLNAVLGMNGLLMDSRLDPEQRHYVELIGKSGESLLAIINDILDLSRLEAGKLTLEVVDFSLGDAIGDVVSMMVQRAQAQGLRLTQRGIGPDMRVRGDPSRLRQVLFNLIGNAIKFTERGEVEVVLEHQALGEGRLAVQLHVRDTGVGIDPDALPLLFQRFSQADSSTSRRFGGTGLGLSICREIVQLMGGSISVDSALGRGSTFTVRLTLTTAAPAEPASVTAQPAISNTTAAGSGLRILVAEDNSINEVLIRALLKKQGHEHDVVADGLHALEQVQIQRYDLVLMDVQMPRLDGVGATKAIRALPGPVGQIPIVAMTANVMTEDRAACEAAGMNGFVGKPINPTRLRHAIEAALAQRVESGVSG